MRRAGARGVIVLKGWLKRVESAARGDLESFTLTDGSRHYYSPSSPERLLHSFDCLRAGYAGEPYPPPPPAIEALTRARDRAAAFQQVAGGNFGLFPYEVEPLIERGELVPREMIAPGQEDFSE